MLSQKEKEWQETLPITTRLAKLEDAVDDLYNLLRETVSTLDRLTSRLVKDKEGDVT